MDLVLGILESLKKAFIVIIMTKNKSVVAGDWDGAVITKRQNEKVFLVILYADYDGGYTTLYIY